ncbi:hypothetical protein Bca4012_017293 [Brassica carinata]
MMSNEIVSSNKKKKKDGLGWMVWLRGWINVLQEILLQRIMASHLHNPFPLPPLHNLTCIVTGSTSGIGSETARQLAEAGAHVVMAVRNIKAAHELIQQWQNKGSSSGKRLPLNIQAMELDLLSLDSVVKFSNAWNARLVPLHVLINNAGMFCMGGAQKFSKDGYEQHLQVNHLAPALLSLLVLPSLIRASQSRIINVNSVVMFNNVLSKRLPLETSISVLCLSPGVVQTNILLHWTCLMVCSSLVRSLIVQAGRIGVFAQGRHQLNHINKTLSVGFGFRTTAAKMMVDSSAGEKRVEMVDMPPEKVDDGGYIGGGWKNDEGSLSCGYCSFRGKRSTMEDFYDVKAFKMEGQTVCMFGIFDGHGGSRAAEYLKKHLFSNLMTHPQFLTDTKLALSETYKQTDVAFLESEKDTYRDDGSTASAAVLVGKHLYVANVGDSRTIVSKAGKAIALSDDHKPNRSDERKRIESAGGVIMWAGTWRVGGVLAMSRAFGNRMLKQFVVAEPEIQDLEIDHEAEFLVLASDGLWDVVPNEDAVSLAQIEEEPVAAARKLTDTAFTRGSADNITCIVVKFHHDKTESQPNPEAEPEPEPEPERNPEDEIQTESSNPNNEMETKSTTEAEMEPIADAMPDPKPETEPETKGEKAG